MSITAANTLLTSPCQFEYKHSDVLVERIPDTIYQNMVNMFSEAYNFNNGEKMNISNYFVKISRSLSDAFVAFINKMISQSLKNQFPDMPTPIGFKPHTQNLRATELNGGFSLGSFDMAVTNNNLQNIEFQAIATYPISAAKLNQYLINNLGLDNAFIFADSPKTTWEDFINLYNIIIGGNEKAGIVLTDRKIAKQKTNFEFFATQKELDVPIDIVDMVDIFEQEGTLVYKTKESTTTQKITRLYSRILLAEALFEDNYPHNTEMWKFRFDKPYASLKYINHPIKQFEISKRLSPYIKHPFNPDCYELLDIVDTYKKKQLHYNDFVWKHKWGAAGHKLILTPTENILDNLSGHWKDYIAQKKVNYKIFKTDDGQEKIVELRFMTAMHEGEMIIVPMARLGHVEKNKAGQTIFKIHFGDNNKAGYGFSPVIIYEN